MADDWKPPASGALDDTPWPEQLSARATEPLPTGDRLHGYAVLEDVARHYRYSDLVYLSIAGELPDEHGSSVFELALCCLATPSVRDASVHLGVLARVSGAPVSSAISAGIVAAADEADHTVMAHRSAFAWFESPTATLPAELHGDERDRSWTRTLLAAHPGATGNVRPEMSRDAACLALLYAAGLRSPDQILAAFVAARVCGIAAEALATNPSHLKDYPVKVPPFRYVEEP